MSFPKAEPQDLGGNAISAELADFARQRTAALTSRRAFAASLAAAGTLAAAGSLAGCSGGGTVVPVTPMSNTPSVVDVLNFALNLEYFEANFYTYVTTGGGIQAAAQGNESRHRYRRSQGQLRQPRRRQRRQPARHRRAGARQLSAQHDHDGAGRRRHQYAYYQSRHPPAPALLPPMPPSSPPHAGLRPSASAPTPGAPSTWSPTPPASPTPRKSSIPKPSTRPFYANSASR